MHLPFPILDPWRSLERASNCDGNSAIGLQRRFSKHCETEKNKLLRQTSFTASLFSRCFWRHTRHRIGFLNHFTWARRGTFDISSQDEHPNKTKINNGFLSRDRTAFAKEEEPTKTVESCETNESSWRTDGLRTKCRTFRSNKAYHRHYVQKLNTHKNADSISRNSIKFREKRWLIWWQCSALFYGHGSDNTYPRVFGALPQSIHSPDLIDTTMGNRLNYC